MKLMGEKGFTLTELIVAVFIMAAIMASVIGAFITLSRNVKIEAKGAETQVEDVLGLELLRYDIEMAGYGLPTSITAPPALGVAYTEAAAASAALYPNLANFVPNQFTIGPNAFNDVSNEPRALIFSTNGHAGADSAAYNDTDVLVIKSQISAQNTVARKWSIRYCNTVDSSSCRNQQWNDATGDYTSNRDFYPGNRVIVVAQNTKTLVTSPGGTWSFTLSQWPDPTNTAGLPNPSYFNMFLIYGVDNVTDTVNPTLSRPFNRVDYYLQRDTRNFPARCHPNSYTLYRGVVDQTVNGVRQEQPIMDCVVDFKAVFGLDTNFDYVVDTWVNSKNAVWNLSTAAMVRQYIREARVYILTHDGGKDPDYTFKGGSITYDGAAYNAKTFPFDNTTLPGYQNYRWKLLKLAVKTVNIVQ
ncbi:MAG: PilW family protein [Nitrospirae bacterium]|nr:PilW family protein [Nitrospirota bacterium]